MITWIKNKWIEFKTYCDEMDVIQGDNLDDISQEDWEAGIASRNKDWDRIEDEHWKRGQLLNGSKTQAAR